MIVEIWDKLYLLSTILGTVIVLELYLGLYLKGSFLMVSQIFLKKIIRRVFLERTFLRVKYINLSNQTHQTKIVLALLFNPFTK